MLKALKCCLNSQLVAVQAQEEHDPEVREALVSDAQSWLALAEIELWLHEHKDEVAEA